MHAMYLLSVYLHILAAIVWVGGMLFLMLVVVPWMRRGERALGVKLLSETGTRFRAVAWICFATVLVTGTFNLWFRGVRFGDFIDTRWHASAFGSAVMSKLAVFVLVVALSAVHDFRMGPRAVAAMRDASRGELASAERMRKSASYIGRVNAVLALVLVSLGVVIVRGWP